MTRAAKHSTWQHGRTGFRWGEWMRCLQGWGSSAARLCEAERSMLPRQANPKHEALQTLKGGPLRITATTLYVPLTTLEAYKARLTFVLESLRICCFQLCLVTNMSASSTGQLREDEWPGSGIPLAGSCWLPPRRRLPAAAAPAVAPSAAAPAWFWQLHGEVLL